MRTQRALSRGFAPLLVGLGLTFVLAPNREAGAQVYVLVQVPPAVVAKAKAPSPPANAQKKAQIGKNGTKLNTADNASDNDSFWVENIDVNGDGVVDVADMLWDDEDRVLFLADTSPFQCKNGGTGSGDVIVALYGNGNTAGKPVGSGWYAVDLDEGECGAKAEGLYGCRFNATGTPTTCGAAVLDDATDDVVITVQKIGKDR